MRRRPLFIALVVLIVLSAWVWRNERGDADQEADEAALELLFPDVQPELVIRFSIIEGEREIVIERESPDSNHWFLIDETRRRASEAHVLAAIRAVAQLESRRTFPADGKKSNYGFSAVTPTVLLEGVDGLLAEISLGGELAVGSGRYVQVRGSADVAVVSADQLLVLERDPMDFRDPRVLALRPGDVQMLRISRPDRSAVVVHRDEEKRFYLDSGPDSSRYRASKEAVNDLLMDLAELKTRRSGDISEAPGGTDEPEISVEVTSAEGLVATLLVGSTDADGDRYVLAAGPLLPIGFGGELVLVSDQSLDKLREPGKSLRSRQLLHFDPKGLQSLSWSVRGVSRQIEHSEDGWHVAGQSEKHVDEKALHEALAGFLRVRALRFVEEDAEAEARGVEAAELHVVERNGSVHGLRLLSGPTRDYAVIKQESGLCEVDDELSRLFDSLLDLGSAGTGPEEVRSTP